MPKLFTTRRKSWRQLLGATRNKQKLSRTTGWGRLKAWSRPRRTAKRKIKREVGYESRPMRAARSFGKRRYLFGIIPLGRWTPTQPPKPPKSRRPQRKRRGLFGFLSGGRRNKK